MRHQGSCHCVNVRFEVKGTLDKVNIDLAAIRLQFVDGRSR